MLLSSLESFHNALVFPAGVKTVPIIALNIHVFDKTHGLSELSTEFIA